MRIHSGRRTRDAQPGGKAEAALRLRAETGFFCERRPKGRGEMRAREFKRGAKRPTGWKRRRGDAIFAQDNFSAGIPPGRSVGFS